MIQALCRQCHVHECDPVYMRCSVKKGVRYKAVCTITSFYWLHVTSVNWLVLTHSYVWLFHFVSKLFSSLTPECFTDSAKWHFTDEFLTFPLGVQFTANLLQQTNSGFCDGQSIALTLPSIFPTNSVKSKWYMHEHKAKLTPLPLHVMAILYTL